MRLSRPVFVAVPLLLGGYLLLTSLDGLQTAAVRTHRSACTAVGLDPVKGAEAPSGLRLTTLEGASYPLSRLRGRFVILNFWLTTCPPCLRELPSLVELARRYQGQGLAMLLVATDREAGAIEAFVQKQPGLRAPPPNLLVLHDPRGKVAKRLGTERFPETYLISTSDRWLGRVVGDRDWVSQVVSACVSSELP